jgi:hypothetical protein
MSRETLAIGNTGTQLVSKFNTNFANTYRKIWNVLEYGAVGDGVTTSVNQKAFQDTINACIAAGGGDVFVPNGVYLFNETLVATNGGITYNSQIYFPWKTLAPETNKVSVRLIGESFQWIQKNNDNIGVVLKSTIAGSGTLPSVISCGDNGLSYLHVEIENILIEVEAFKTTTGISMNGINMVFISAGYVNNVRVRSNVDTMAETIEPATPVFGLAIGYPNNDFPRIGYFNCHFGFTYGLIIGEGVVADQVLSLGNKYGILVLNNFHPPLINWVCTNWCAYSIVSQQATMFGVAKTTALGRIKINMLTHEDNVTPAWLDEVDTIFDPDNILVGTMDYNLVAGGSPYLITKANGGVNLLARPYNRSAYHWVTTARPIYEGNMGYNETTDKMEWYDGSNWHDV